MSTINKILSAKKICIVGMSGAGKTRLSLILTDILGIPVFHIDDCRKHIHLPESEKRANVLADIDYESNKQTWIIDGTWPRHTEALELRIGRADLVIHLYMPVPFCVKNIATRGVQNNWDENEIERMLRSVHNYGIKRDLVDAVLYRHIDKVITLNTPDEVNAMVAELRNNS